jgi:hypothetical protein
LDEFNSQSAVETSPCFKGKAKKLHPELFAPDPFDLAEVD